MTTIAYKKGFVACDSRVTKDNFIVDDSYEKLITKDGVAFFVCGATSDYGALIDAYLARKYDGDSENIDAVAFVIDKGFLYTCAIHNKEFWRSPARYDNPIALGSGRDFAIAFMDAGMSAEEAVKASCKRDSASGGEIRVYSVDSLLHV